MIYPTFFVKLPISGKRMQIRQMFCSEEKILLYAKESNESEDMYNSARDVIQNCLIDSTLDDLCEVDFISLFMKLRSLSISNRIEVNYKDKEDEQEYSFIIDLETLQIKSSKESKLRPINVDNDISITLKYPKISFEKIDIKDCIDKVINKDDTVNFSDSSDNEQQEFIDDLPMSVVEQLTKFSKNIPHLYHKITYKNKNEKDRKIEIKTFEDFFMLATTGRSLKNYFNIMVYLSKRTYWDYASIEKMTPFERDNYLDMFQIEDKKLK